MVEFLELKSWANDICVPITRAILLTAVPTIMAIFIFAQFSHFILLLQQCCEALPLYKIYGTAAIRSPPVSERIRNKIRI